LCRIEPDALAVRHHTACRRDAGALDSVTFTTTVPMVACMHFPGMPRGETAEMAAPMLLSLKLSHGQRDPTG
jgi:hypothetical protein